MEYRTLGQLGDTVSRIGFGGAVAGIKNYINAFDPSKVEDQNRIIGAVEEAIASGINYYDTAPAYGNGQSEIILGKALDGVKESNGHPLFIATKALYSKRGSLKESIETSLKHLRRDKIDLMQIHGDSYTPEMVDDILSDGGMVDEMLRLKAEGYIRYIGFTSEDNNDAVYRLIRSGKFDMMQICYNFINQHPYEPSRPFGSLYEAHKAGMYIATMRTPTSGTFQRWLQMVNPENTFDYTPALIQFVLSNPLVDVALLGMHDASIVRKNVAIVEDTDNRINIDEVHNRFI